MRKALAGEPLTLAGDGMQTRRFVYVEDLADGIVRALAPEAANRVYNLAGNETVTIRRLAETVRRQVGEVEIVHTPGRNGDFVGSRDLQRARRRRARLGGVDANTPRGLGYRDWVEHGQPQALRSRSPTSHRRRASSASPSAASARSSGLRSPTCSPRVSASREDSFTLWR